MLAERVMKKLHPSILSITSISNSYGEKQLLKEVSFQLHEGEILCLLGPSGSGKTTLLRLIAGLETDFTGDIVFKGQSIQTTPPHKRGFGLMFQEYALFPHKTVGENISFGLEMQRVSATQAEHQVNKMLRLVGLAGYQNRRIDELSGGEKQRVALARSLAPEPQLLLLDEPLGSLDRILRERLIVEIRDILKEIGVTAVFVTHDQNEAFGVADKIAILQDGSLQQFAPPEDLYRTPENTEVAKFLGFRNLFQISFDYGSQTIQSPFGQIKLTGRAPKSSDEAILLLRPDGAKLQEETGTITNDSIVLRGIVAGRRYQGGSYNVKVDCNSETLYFDMPLDPPPPQKGEAIGLTISPTSILLLE